jgi:hypothetical protein
VPGRNRGEDGLALPSPVAAVAVAAVLVAGGVFVATADESQPPARAATAAAASPSPTVAAPTPTLSPDPSPTAEARSQKRKAQVRRSEVYVEVYNNSNIAGLAGSTAGDLSGAGWQVVGSDNWYGTIPASTVYYPERLAAAGKLLAKDLGVTRLKPAVAPMRFDRLTVILTSDFT